MTANPVWAETASGHCRLGIDIEHGGRIHELTLADASGVPVTIIQPIPGKEVREGNPWFRNIMLYPFVNRLDSGSYHWNGKDYTFFLNEPQRHNALHGFMYQLTPELVHVKNSPCQAELELLYQYDGSNPGYPFPANITVTYILNDQQGMTVATALHNLADIEVPAAIGWHPYFSLEQSVDQLLLSLPEAEAAEVDSRMLPTGRNQRFDGFRHRQLIGNMQLDQCLRLSAENEDKACITVQSDNHTLQLWSDRKATRWKLPDKSDQKSVPGYSHIQVFTHPDRGSLAIEPMTAGINALNTCEDLITLKPEEHYRVLCGVQLK